MSEVDYSKFYYKRNTRTKGPPSRARKRAAESATQKSGEAFEGAAVGGARAGRKGNGLFVLTVLILCTAIVFAVANSFGGGFLSEYVSALFKGNSYNYYLVAAEFSSRELAYANSAIVKEGGGSGYIMQDGNYFVVYSLYSDKGAANKVAAKNNRTFVKEISYKSKNTEVFNCVNDVVYGLSTACTGYENGEITESELLSVINTQTAKVTALSQKLDAADSSSKLLQLTLACLNNLNIAKGTKMENLSAIRFAASSIAVNMADYI